MNVVAVVVVGAGSAAASDVFAPLGGEPLVVRSVRAMLGVERVDRVLLVVPAGLVERAAQVCAELPVVVRGSFSEQAHTGQRRDAAESDDPITASFDDVVVVHDAARPLAPPELVEAVIDAVLSGHAAAVPVLPLTDTVKLVDARGDVQGTPDRATLRVVQTPQAFRADVARRVFPSVALDPTHGWSAAGSVVHTVPGHPLAFPVRGSWDLELAELLSTPQERVAPSDDVTAEDG